MRVLTRSNLRAALGSQYQSPCIEVRDGELQSSRILLNLPHCPKRLTPQLNSPMAGQYGHGNTYTPLFKCPHQSSVSVYIAKEDVHAQLIPSATLEPFLRGLTCRSNTPLLFTYSLVNSPKCSTRSRSTSRKTLPEPH